MAVLQASSVDVSQLKQITTALGEYAYAISYFVGVWLVLIFTQFIWGMQETPPLCGDTDKGESCCLLSIVAWRLVIKTAKKKKKKESNL